jgi:hypothetical protein
MMVNGELVPMQLTPPVVEAVMTMVSPAPAGRLEMKDGVRDPVVFRVPEAISALDEERTFQVTLSMVVPSGNDSATWISPTLPSATFSFPQLRESNIPRIERAPRRDDVCAPCAFFMRAP